MGVFKKFAFSSFLINFAFKEIGELVYSHLILESSTIFLRESFKDTDNWLLVRFNKVG